MGRSQARRVPGGGNEQRRHLFLSAPLPLPSRLDPLRPGHATSPLDNAGAFLPAPVSRPGPSNPFLTGSRSHLLQRRSCPLNLPPTCGIFRDISAACAQPPALLLPVLVGVLQPPHLELPGAPGHRVRGSPCPSTCRRPPASRVGKVCRKMRQLSQAAGLGLGARHHPGAGQSRPHWPPGRSPASRILWGVTGPGGCATRLWPAGEVPWGLLLQKVSSAGKGDGETGLSWPLHPGIRALQKPTHSLPREVGATLTLQTRKLRQREREGSCAPGADRAGIRPQSACKAPAGPGAHQAVWAHLGYPSSASGPPFSIFNVFSTSGPLPGSSFSLEHFSHHLSHYGVLARMFPPRQGCDLLGMGVRWLPGCLLCLLNSEPCDYIT